MRIYEDLRQVHTRLAVAQYVMLALLGALLLQYWNLQVLRARHFRDLAEQNRMRTVHLAAPRGIFFDREGTVLAENRASFNILLTPEHSLNLDRAVARLAPLLNMTQTQIRVAVAARGAPYRAAGVKADAPLADVAAIEARRLELPEVDIEVVPLRAYPLGTAAAHPLGRVGEVTDQQLATEAFASFEPGDLVGQSGIELQYNASLLGVDGERRVVVNSRGAEVDEAARRPPTEGPALRLAIDARLQAAMQRAFRGRAGSAVALDPSTGDVLGLVSTPAYDPNRFATRLEPGAWQELATNEATPLMNRVIQGQYAPGSVFKVVAAAAGLEEGLITPDTVVRCNGSIRLYGNPFRCLGHHGAVKLRAALAHSCNIYFYQLGVRLEIEGLAKWARRFGLGSRTGIDLPGEQPGLVPDIAWKRRVRGAAWFPGETVSVSIGQGQTLTTPLQLARMVAAIANGGQLVTPRLVQQVGDTSAVRPAPRGLQLSEGTRDAIHLGLCDAVNEWGTAWRARLASVEVCGKTGSAQVVARPTKEQEEVPERLRAHAWFVGYAPGSDPRIALAVLVEHGGSGGAAAAPVAGEIIAQYLGLPAERAPSDIVPNEAD